MTSTPTRTALAIACAPMADEQLFAQQLAARGATHDRTAFVFRDHESVAGMAEQVLSALPRRFTLIGLSLGVVRGVTRRVGKLPMANRHHDLNNIRR